MSRMTTSRASFPCASAAIRRAWSIGLKLSQCSRRAGCRDPRRGSARQRAGGSSAETSSPAARRARSPRDENGSGSISKKVTRVGSSSWASTVSSCAGGKPGRVATARRVSRNTSAGSFHEGKSRNWSAPIRKTGSCHSGCARSRSTVAGQRIEHDLVVGEGGARQLQTDLGGRLHVLVARIGGDEHEQALEPELLLRAARQLDVAEMRWVERAAVQAERQASSNSSSPTSTVAPCFAPAAFKARSSSSSDGGVPRTRKPPSVRRSRHCRAFGCGR